MIRRSGAHVDVSCRSAAWRLRSRARLPSLPDTTTTGDPPGPCDELVPSDPANEFISGAAVPTYNGDEHALQLGWYEDGNSWSVLFNLGTDGPTVGVVPAFPYSGETYVGPAGGSAAGTATLELIEVTPACVVGRISGVMEMDDDMWISEMLPGGFVAVRMDV